MKIVRYGAQFSACKLCYEQPEGSGAMIIIASCIYNNQKG
jgi:hypothetical protein